MILCNCKFIGFLTIALLLSIPNNLFSNSIDTLENDWKNQIKEADKQGKDKQAFLNKTLDNILNKMPDKQLKDIEAETIVKLSNNTYSEFQTALYHHFVNHYIQSGQKQKLIKIWCVCFYSPLYMDSWIYLIAKDHLEMFDAFFDVVGKTKNKRIRNMIITGLSQAFPKIRNKYKDDKIFIKESRQWFIDNRKNIVVRSAREFGAHYCSEPVDLRELEGAKREEHKGLFKLKHVDSQ